MIISITKLGIDLREKAKNIPMKISKCIDLEEKDALQLYKLLYKSLSNFEVE